jgi:hypothetical protein
MNRKDALAELIAKVEAGSIAAHDLDAFVPALDFTATTNDAHMAYRGSLDAAKALHDAVLPGAWCDSEQDDDNSFHFTVFDNGQHEGWATTPARAWLLAILRALHAQEAAE